MDLTLSFLREELRPFLQDQLFYVPHNYEEHHLWQFPLIPEKTPIAIEYCSGNGQWILERATKDPSIFWIAVEMKWERARKIWKKVAKEHLTNLLVVYGEAFTFTQHYLPKGSVQEIFVNFPDPWPKRRHSKHRLIQKPFVGELSRIIKIGGRATFVTDDPAYSEIICQEMLASPNFHPLFSFPHYITEWPEYGTSFFENLWKSKGLLIRYMQFLRHLCPTP